ncbi:MAG: response regulator [Bryobacteraceae bacterium]
MTDPIRVLIVEDNPADAELAVYQLKRAGFVPEWRRVETEAQYLAGLDEAPELILADASLPQFDGLRALDLLHGRELDIPFLLVSGSLGEDRAVDAMKRGAYDYLLKDRLSRLGEAVKRALEQRRLRAESVSAGEALRQSEERYRLISEVTSDYAYALCIGPGGSFVCDWTTTPFERLTGFSIEEINARGWNSLYHPEDLEVVSRHQQALLSNRPDLMEVRTVKKNGEVRWVRAYARAMPEGGDDCVMRVYGAAQDITAHRELEQQLLQSQKMEAIGQLAGGVAHDFNNLLTVINGHGHLLEKGFASGKPTVEHLEPILDAANRASRLTRQLLAFSRRQKLDFKKVNLNVVVTEIQKLLGRMISEDIELRTVLDPSLGFAKADSAQMEQVIMNLVVNARDAMPKGGQLTIETVNVDLDGEFTGERGALEPGSYVMMSVRDTGVGMDKELQKRIFEPFFTTKEVGKGTGLGLATVYGIVKQSGGEVRVHSEHGLGSTFQVYLPRIKGEEPATSEPTVTPAAPAMRSAETILVVEDEAAVRKLVVEVLADEGYTILQTGKASEAPQIAKEFQGNISLLLTDVVMPKMSGPQVAEQILQFRPDIKVVYMSGYTANAVILPGGVSQAEATLLTKPFTPEVLLSTVRETLGALRI